MRAEDEYRNLILQYPDNKAGAGSQAAPAGSAGSAGANASSGSGGSTTCASPIRRRSRACNRWSTSIRCTATPMRPFTCSGRTMKGRSLRIRKFANLRRHGLPRGCISEKAAKAQYIRRSPPRRPRPAYDKILTRYPLMDRSDDAKKRLAALHQPVPRPTKAAVAQNRKEIESRSESSMIQQMMGLIKKGPDVATTTRSGEPSLVDPPPFGGRNVILDESREAGALLGVQAMPEPGGGGKTGSTIEILNQPGTTGAAPPADATPPNASPFGSAGCRRGSAGSRPERAKAKRCSGSKRTEANRQRWCPAASTAGRMRFRGKRRLRRPRLPPTIPARPATRIFSSSKKKKKKGLRKIVPF